MAKYHVSFMCVYAEEVEADSPEEAVEYVARYCPCDIDGEASVTNLDTGEYWDI